MVATLTPYIVPDAEKDLYVYGELLTPVVDSGKTDNKVTTISGFVSLASSYNINPNLEGITVNTINNYFRAVAFSQQRLYLGGFRSSSNVKYGTIVAASQIGKYNDFKNNNNAANEGFVIDVASQAIESVQYLVDYNGLLIYTDAGSYIYTADTGARKQNDIGIWENCAPALVKSQVIYADHTGKYIRAQQYDLQTDIYQSSVINQLAKDDLVFEPVALASYEDRENHTGTYLFVINNPIYTGAQSGFPAMAVCNWVPVQQNNIWTRWTLPGIPYSYDITNTTTTLVRCAYYNAQYGVVYINPPVDYGVNINGRPLLDVDGNMLTNFSANYVWQSQLGNNSITVRVAERGVEQGFFAWRLTGNVIRYTKSATPAVGDLVYAWTNYADTTLEYPDRFVWGVGDGYIYNEPEKLYAYRGSYPTDASQLTRYYFENPTLSNGDIVWGDNPYSSPSSEPYEVFMSGSTPCITRIFDGESHTVELTRNAGEDITYTQQQWSRYPAGDVTETVYTYDYADFSRNTASDVINTETSTTHHEGQTSLIQDVVKVGNKVYFLVKGVGAYNRFRIAELDTDGEIDFLADVSENKYAPNGIIFAGATVQVYNGNEYAFDATVGNDGTLTPSTSELSVPRAGFMINAEIISHPIDVNGKTYTDKKRIAKAVAAVRDTEPGAFTVNDKTGYMTPDKTHVNFYGCTGMKDKVQYTIKNIKGAKFTIESLTMNIEYGTLIS